MQLRFRHLFWPIFFLLWLAVIMAFAFGGLYLYASGHHPPDDRSPSMALILLLAGATVSLPVAVGLAWYISTPVRHLSQALRDAAQARFDVRVLPALGNRGPHEFTFLAREFDEMAARLQHASMRQRQLFHDVSHELRSPLARIQAAIGLMQQDAKSAPGMVERISRETERLNQLIEELLTLHKLEVGAMSPPRERVDIIELLADIVQDAAFEAQSRGCIVTLDAPVSFVAEVAGEPLYRALENVVRNAIKYTAACTAVEVCARTLTSFEAGEKSDWLEVRVSDRGPGVPAGSCEDIFEPFHRLEPQQRDAIMQSVSGTGLGLAIARRAIALHDGDIHAAPREGGGLTVIARLPRCRIN
ncbi:TPA: HAMP domain-containing sensor histidine kinase [Burkholderia cenocepacia]|uniref:histidine kinase n=1 Tax=Burkholderia latens TaxID=488446 RepID=A0A6H9SUT1_9BURK|nr:MULTISPECIES: ATP-binding protein [Burkholderia]KAB0644481.1 HAMP domain-containing protein [Burkholderia latens]MBJ9922862.1 HAMP domain-containing protein [Burkholderia cenocepacia]UJH78802.1 ATP-binding protein [Burkholderia cenocepacia]VWB23220.1 two-component system sensor histidine kinase [Burkholderia latens]HDR9879873.1 HAMP domain-containing protein [Burkholderia cenocepacia]